MKHHESNLNASAGASMHEHLRGLLLGWRRNRESADESYLAAATDHADLERRQQALERAALGPAVVTFNH